MYKKYLYSGAISLIAVFTLSACAKPKLDVKLSVNDIIYMSRRALKLKDDQTLVEASFKREQISEDMKNELKTSTKQFYLKDEDGKKVTASKIDKDDLPTLLTNYIPYDSLLLLTRSIRICSPFTIPLPHTLSHPDQLTTLPLILYSQTSTFYFGITPFSPCSTYYYRNHVYIFYNTIILMYILQ